MAGDSKHSSTKPRNNSAERVAESTYGNGELRFTVWQNVLIPNIPDRHVDEVKRELDLLGLGYDASYLRCRVHGLYW